eukprot:CAMPEP_0170518464 /NCGR_PEP_ID=MMETSP0209-20121228/4145_1 /TAXON_ID=665100 ORGANISM="Litonotus pictus, Strain P1" /NCGR_SAMPLE_ID=MMETSP0209 /ASSEMBLY_ACC=CAM_ASM_000301 /LENGTH=355 /DNA_ID=CAMNT_0010804033 /DNA_START=168 /DNA_END=1235 /DNA_ORIENTATION=+
MRIQSIIRRFLSKAKFHKRITLQTLALKEFFRTHGVLCEQDDIDSFVSPFVRDIETRIRNREGIYSNSALPENLMDDLSYQPFYSLEMPCTFLVENKDDNHLLPSKSNPNLDKDNNFSTNNHSEVEGNSQARRPVYKGHWSLDRKKNGYGILVNSDGSKYEGLFRNEKLDGKGRYITIKGDFFEGFFSNGCACGYGVFVHSDGSIYKGNWMNDLPWGEGEEWSNEGSYYKGDFFQGKKFGVGEFRWKDGAVYLGGVKNDLLNGEGIYSWPDGRRYKGFWQDNNMQGYGVLENPDGSRYEGQFDMNKKSGKGVYHYNKEKFYEGNWENGKQHGKGKIVKNGVVEEGLWSEGKRLKD